MFRGRPWTRRAGVAILVLASFITSTAALPHTEGLEDLACNPVLVSHDETAHHIGSASASSHSDAEHCFLCHTARSFCSVLERFELRDDARRADTPHTSPFDRSAAVDWTVGPGRAPPA
jgi:hypothetical protein